MIVRADERQAAWRPISRLTVEGAGQDESRHAEPFIRRFLMHVLPQGFHRIRYYGLLASAVRADNIARAREMLAVPLIPINAIKATTKPDEPKAPEHPCPCCGGRMIIIETFERGCLPRHRPTPTPAQIRIDTS